MAAKPDQSSCAIMQHSDKTQEQSLYAIYM